ncbi:MAG TPA: S8 family serine peptidase [Candidatus Limnocylindria bacterium]|nr:S8 family serine peptidase [Candidatus Limnocylindria bacterium]
MAAIARTFRNDKPAHAALAALLALIVAVASTLAAVGVGRSHALVPVIVRYPSAESPLAAAAAADQATTNVLKLGGSVDRSLAVIEAFAARVPANRLWQLVRMPGIAAVTPDQPLQLSHAIDGFNAETAQGSMYNVAWQIGARSYWEKGLTGKGVDVAIIDSGVNAVAGLDGSSKLVYGPDLSFERMAPGLRNLDTYGHGTHMAGIIAGRDAGVSGSLSQNHDDFIGIAPGARVISLKVANAVGSTDTSQVIAAIQWVIDNRTSDGLNIRVLNLSFGTDGIQHYTIDPLSYAVEKAWRAGIVVVVAAGNGGFGSASLNNPAYNPHIIAVGADDTKGTTRLSDDVIPAFSSTGDNTRNPDIVAPGQSIVSLRVPGSHIDLTYPKARVNSRFFRGSGTSHAAAVVSGAAALIIQQRPGISPDELKHLVNSTAGYLPSGHPDAQGNGLIQLSDAFSTPTSHGTVQSWQAATGTGSLDAARGSMHVVDPNGVELRGEMDIFGRPFDEGQWGTPCTDDTSAEPCFAWSGNSWSGGYWSGDGWSGNSWSGNSWSSDSWSGNSWSGNSWSGNSWSGNLWSASSWMGVSWGRKAK